MKKLLDLFNEDTSRITDKGYFVVEVNVTEQCNFKCSYCFEGDTCDSTRTNEYIDSIIARVEELRMSDWFARIYRGIKFDFWGGEPTLRPDIIKRIVDQYRDDARFIFHVYTNGYTVDPILEIFDGIYDRFTIQVSYDGNPIHDQNRLHKNDTTTSEKVKENIKKLADAGTRVSLKSTLRPADFKYMPEAWEDIKEIFLTHGGLLNYNPTIDYHNEYDADAALADLKESLIKIARKEVDYYKEHGAYLCTWFASEGISYCNLFKNGMFVDVDGGLYYCHGCPYHDCDDLRFGHIDDENIVDLVMGNFYKFNRKADANCSKCLTNVCMSCNVEKYINSKKTDFLDRWYDLSCEPQICQYYKHIGKVSRAVNDLVRRD